MGGREAEREVQKTHIHCTCSFITMTYTCTLYIQHKAMVFNMFMYTYHLAGPTTVHYCNMINTPPLHNTESTVSKYFCKLHSNNSGCKTTSSNNMQVTCFYCKTIALCMYKYMCMYILWNLSNHTIETEESVLISEVS